MSMHLVNRVIDGDTLNVTPNWRYGGRQGSRVRIADVYAPEINHAGGPAAKARLSGHVLQEYVELTNPQGLSYDRLVCDVFLDGRSVATLI